jgi:hypothetical protein
VVSIEPTKHSSPDVTDEASGSASSSGVTPHEEAFIPRDKREHWTEEGTSAGALRLEDGERVPFDFCVICTVRKRKHERCTEMRSELGSLLQ